jgi:preprotein translocase subunit YajC
MSYFSAVATVAATALHGPLLAATKKASGSSLSILILVVIVAAGYFLLIRPQRQRARTAQMQNKNVAVGDEVMLTSGIFGRVTGIEGDRANVEVAPDIEIEVVTRAIAQRVTPADVVAEPLPVSPDPAGDEDEDFAHASDDPSENDEAGAPLDHEAGHDGAPESETAWPPTAVKPAESDPGSAIPGGGIAGGGGGEAIGGGGLAGDGSPDRTRRSGRGTG